MSRPSLVVILAEDKRHQGFIRRYLKRLGYSLRDMRFRELPSGRGCGEQWVRERYSEEVAAYRLRSARADSALVVLIDADGGDANRRLQQLQQGLNNAGQEARSGRERIIHMIPRRNIETWILCLDGRLVDEETDYRHEPEIDELISRSAETFFEWTRPNAAVPAYSVASLRTAIPEAQRLDHER